MVPVVRQVEVEFSSSGNASGNRNPHFGFKDACSVAVAARPVVVVVATVEVAVVMFVVVVARGSSGASWQYWCQC